ncbi:MAG: hypothetical protein ACK4Z0_08885 [Sphingomonadaceae bacterium]
MLNATLPALLLVALANATAPPLALGQVPLCTAAGIAWSQPDGAPAGPGEDGRQACAHGWCASRRALRPA